MENKLKLTNAEIVFANLEEKDGFKPSLTIKVTAQNEKLITDFWAEQKIGKNNPGVVNFKEYTNGEGVTTKQLNLALNPQTKFGGLNGLTENDLGFGAKVNLFVNAFTYNNKFSGGKDKVSANISACVVLEGKKTGADADLAELLGESANNSVIGVSVTPQSTPQGEDVSGGSDVLPF